MLRKIGKCLGLVLVGWFVVIPVIGAFLDGCKSELYDMHDIESIPGQETV